MYIIKRLLYFILILILIYLTYNKLYLGETIYLYFLYIIFFKEKFIILVYSSLLLFFYDYNLFIKNILIFIMYEFFCTIFIDKPNINKKGKYRLFLLTFFLYLVLINIFEPIVYNYTRIYNSINLYLLVLIMYKIDYKFVKRGVTSGRGI